MLNLTECITSIKMDLGIYGMVLPFDNQDEALTDVIKYKTLPIYSTYAPYRIVAKFKYDEMKQLEVFRDYITYQIPTDRFGERKIISIDHVYPDTTYQSNTYLPGASSYSMCDYKNMMLNSMDSQLVHYVSPKFSFEYIEPNKIKLYNMGILTNGIAMEIGLSHDITLNTINEGHRESFMELALVDVKRFLYNSLRNYDEIQTAYGSIKLRTDEWSGAESERKDLLERWKSIHHLEGDTLYFI